MTESEKAELLSAMKAKRENLLVLIEQLREQTKPMGLDSAIGRVSCMDYINNKSVREASLRKSETDLKAIERWLSLENEPEFGKCVRCKNEINPKRLLFLPSSTMCIRCAGR